MRAGENGRGDRIKRRTLLVPILHTPTFSWENPFSVRIPKRRVVLIDLGGRNESGERASD